MTFSEHDRRTRVLMIAPVGQGVGGIISQTNELVNSLRGSAVIDLRVIDSTQRYRAIHNYALASRAFGGTAHAARILAQLIRLLCTFRPAVLHIASSASLGLFRDIVVLAVARMASVRVYLRFHFGRIPEVAARGGWEWALLRQACRLADRVQVLDRRSQSLLAAAFPRSRIELFSNAVGIAAIDAMVCRAQANRTDTAAVKIVFAGMVVPNKGVIELVEACSLIQAPEFELEIVGPVGPVMQDRLETTARVRGGGRWLRFTGGMARPDAIRRIAAADIFVLPSYTEGFPISVLEAMACGAAIIATNVGALPDALTGVNGEPAGVVVPPADTEALRDAIQNLLNDVTQRRQYGVAARKKCEACYDFPVLVSRLTSAWRQCEPTGATSAT